MKNIKNKKIINNMEFNDKYDLQKAKNLFFLSDNELLEYTNHTEYDDDENHKYIKIIKNSLHQILLNNKSENKIIYEVKDCNRLYSKDKISLQYFIFSNK